MSIPASINNPRAGLYPTPTLVETAFRVQDRAGDGHPQTLQKGSAYETHIRPKDPLTRLTFQTNQLPYAFRVNGYPIEAAPRLDELAIRASSYGALFFTGQVSIEFFNLKGDPVHRYIFHFDYRQEDLGTIGQRPTQFIRIRRNGLKGESKWDQKTLTGKIMPELETRLSMLEKIWGPNRVQAGAGKIILTSSMRPNPGFKELKGFAASQTFGYDTVVISEAFGRDRKEWLWVLTHEIAHNIGVRLNEDTMAGSAIHAYWDTMSLENQALISFLQETPQHLSCGSGELFASVTAILAEGSEAFAKRLEAMRKRYPQAESHQAEQELLKILDAYGQDLITHDLMAGSQALHAYRTLLQVSSQIASHP